MPGTVADVAQWMLSEYKRRDRLTQSLAASKIRQLFGNEFVYKNANRNWAIQKAVLDEFRRLTPTGVVWSRSQQLWRKRNPLDRPGRMVR